MDESAFVFETENIKGNEADYSRSAVIMGLISHREVYPNTTVISIEIPFYDRVSEKQTSAIFAYWGPRKLQGIVNQHRVRLFK